MEMSARYKIVNDSVHGYIRLHPLCVKIIDTPEFQRLRNLKQLAAVYFVYPGASHNRFEHSLGVCHLAGKMVEALRENSNDKDIISEDEKLCLEIAGLCHDLRHGPFSHIWQNYAIAARNEKGTIDKLEREERSVEMFEYLLNENNLHSEVEAACPKLNGKAVDFIKELIIGEGTVIKNKKYLYQIICNKETGIDVDKWDYMLRDGRQLNLSISFDFSRLLQFCRVDKVGEEKVICFHSKERHNIYDMFLVRVNLYHKGYFHKVAKTVEEMIIDAFVEADRNGFTIQVADKVYRLSEADDNVKVLSCLTDHILYDILYSTKADFEKARQLLQRVLKRDLYPILACRNFSTELQNAKARFIEEWTNVEEFDKQVKEKKTTFKQDIEEDIRKISPLMQHCKLEQFKILIADYDMGVEKKGASISPAGKINPFSNIYFYDKNNVEEAREMQWKDIPVLPVPEETMCHIHYVVIYKNIEYPASMNEALKNELQVLKTELNRLWGD